MYYTEPYEIVNIWASLTNTNGNFQMVQQNINDGCFHIAKVNTYST